MNFEPDEFFTAEQKKRLKELCAKKPLSRKEQAELTTLIESELLATIERVKKLTSGTLPQPSPSQ